MGQFTLRKSKSETRSVANKTPTKQKILLLVQHIIAGVEPLDAFKSVWGFPDDIAMATLESKYLAVHRRYRISGLIASMRKDDDVKVPDNKQGGRLPEKPVESATEDRRRNKVIKALDDIAFGGVEVNDTNRIKALDMLGNMENIFKGSPESSYKPKIMIVKENPDFRAMLEKLFKIHTGETVQTDEESKETWDQVAALIKTGCVLESNLVHENEEKEDSPDAQA
jgi:hypothetical protein